MFHFVLGSRFRFTLSPNAELFSCPALETPLGHLELYDCVYFSGRLGKTNNMMDAENLHRTRYLMRPFLATGFLKLTSAGSFYPVWLCRGKDYWREVTVNSALFCKAVLQILCMLVSCSWNWTRLRNWPRFTPVVKKQVDGVIVLRIRFMPEKATTQVAWTLHCCLVACLSGTHRAIIRKISYWTELGIV